VAEADEHDGQDRAALLDHFDQAFEAHHRLGMEIVCLINEQRHGPASALDQVPQPALPQLGLRGQGGLFVGADVGEDRLHKRAELDAFLVHG
jgi:hypothetical protein